MRWPNLVVVAGLALSGVVHAVIPDFAGAPPKPASNSDSANHCRM